MTVSRVVRGLDIVRPATRHRVELAMAELGYVPNRLARGLVAGRSGLLALVVADLTHPWFTDLARHLEEAAALRGYTVTLGNSGDEPLREAAYLETMASLQVDGMVVAPAERELGAGLRLVASRGIPLVLVDRRVDGLKADLIRGESHDAALKLTEHLVEHGHRRLAVISGPRHVSTAVERAEGFLAALDRLSMSPPPGSVRYGPYTREFGQSEGMRLLQRPRRPTAILAGNSSIALGVLDAARRLDLDVPGDLGLATFDDPEELAVEPFLTCAVQPAGEIGRLAFEALLERIQGLTDPPREVVLESSYRFRRSCGCAA